MTWFKVNEKTLPAVHGSVRSLNFLLPFPPPTRDPMNQNRYTACQDRLAVPGADSIASISITWCTNDPPFAIDTVGSISNKSFLMFCEFAVKDDHFDNSFQAAATSEQSTFWSLMLSIAAFGPLV